MVDEKTAAIDVDKLGEMTLKEISAADFLEALKAGSVSVDRLTLWPEKKKKELWAEPERIGTVKCKDFIDLIGSEKKKIEREIDPWYQVMPLKVLDQLVNSLTTVLKQRRSG